MFAMLSIGGEPPTVSPQVLATTIEYLYIEEANPQVLATVVEYLYVEEE